MAESSVKGKFVWQELTTVDPAGAAAFYGKIAGWHAHPSAFDPAYIELGGDSHVAGIMKLPEGGHPGWLPYIGADDVDESVASVERLGGKVIHAANDLAGVGRFAIVSDPQGAAFALFKPASATAAASSTAKPGEFAWQELTTTDSEAAFTFYAELFGWQALQRMDMGPSGTYLIFGEHGVQRGGMYKLQGQKSPGPHWLPYIEVPDADAAAASASAAGGKIIAGPMDVPGGRMVQLHDPSGALIAVHARGKTAAPAKPAAAKKSAPKKAAAAPAKAAEATSKGPPAAVKPPPAKNAPLVAKKAAKKVTKQAAKKVTKKVAKKVVKKTPAKKAAGKQAAAKKKLAKKAVKKPVAKKAPVKQKSAKKTPKKAAAKKPKKAAKRKK